MPVGPGRKITKSETKGVMVTMRKIQVAALLQLMVAMYKSGFSKQIFLFSRKIGNPSFYLNSDGFKCWKDF